MAMQGFIDDSYGKKDQCYVLAGFIATVDSWLNFSKDWKEELDRIPAMPYFKMNEIVRTRSGPFKGWTEVARQERLNSFAKVIRKHALVRVDSRIKIEDYERYIKGKVHPDLDHPYFICFYQIATATLKFQVQNRWQEHVDFIFDEQGNIGLEAIKWWGLLKAILPAHERLIGETPTFRDDKKMLPLQAADFYAWSIRNESSQNKIISIPRRQEMEFMSGIPRIEGCVEASVLAQGFNVDHLRTNKRHPLQVGP